MIDLLQVLSGSYAESEPKDFSELIDEDEQAENYDYHSDSDLEDDEDVLNAGNAPKKVTPLKSDPLSTDVKKSTSIYGEWNESPGRGTIIKIHDIAFITYAPSNPHRCIANHRPGFKPF